MTAPTLSAYPKPVDDLVPAARDLAAQLGTVPSRNRIKKELHVGGPKADAILAELTRTPPPAPPADNEPTPEPTDTRSDPTEPTPPTTADSGSVVNPPPATDDIPPTVDPQPTPVVDPGTNITTAPPKTGSGDRVAGRGWAYIGVALGGAVSIAANVAHTYLPKPPDGVPDGWTSDPNWSPSLLAVVLSVFWPVALFVAVEILTRIPWGNGHGSTIARISGVLPVALVSAVVSYRHLSGLLEHYGEDPLTVAIGPLAVDGLMIMASAALLAISRRKATQT